MPGPFSPEALQAVVHALSAHADTATRTETPQGIGPLPYLAFAGGQAADAITTAQAIGRGAREGNPLLGKSLASILATKGGIDLLTLLAMRKLSANHPKVAKTLGYVGGAVGGAAALHNTAVGR